MQNLVSQPRLTESEPALNKIPAHLHCRCSDLGSSYKSESVGSKVDTLQAGKDRVLKGLECHAEGDGASATEGGRAGSNAVRSTFLIKKNFIFNYS